MTMRDGFGWPVTICGGPGVIKVIGGQRCLVSRNDSTIYTLEAVSRLAEGEQWLVSSFERHRKDWGESFGGPAEVGRVRGALWVPEVAELRGLFYARVPEIDERLAGLWMDGRLVDLGLSMDSKTETISASGVSVVTRIHEVYTVDWCDRAALGGHFRELDNDVALDLVQRMMSRGVVEAERLSRRLEVVR